MSMFCYFIVTNNFFCSVNVQIQAIVQVLEETYSKYSKLWDFIFL